MPSQQRHSLAEEVAQSLGDAHDPETGENVEAILLRVEEDLETSNKQLAQSEEKERFLATRIKKYNQLLKQQEEHLQKLKDDPEQQEHYQEQLKKQQSNKEALGKVVDVHIQILKNCKEIKYTIAKLEQKRAQLTNTTKQFREFLVMAEETEREQLAGVESDLEMNEMESLHDGAATITNTEEKEDEENKTAQKETDEEKAFIKSEDGNLILNENDKSESGEEEAPIAVQEDTEAENAKSSGNNNATQPSVSAKEDSHINDNNPQENEEETAKEGKE